MNIKSIFLYKDFDKKIYFNFSDDFQDEKDIICRFLKFLYNLKQASWVWIKVLREFLIKYDLVRLESDHCVYIEKNLIIIIYINDIFILSKNKQFLQKIKAELKSWFKMSNLEFIKHYLNIKIHQIKKKICLTQTEYIINMLKYFNIKNCTSKSTFMNEKIQLNFINNNNEILADNSLFDINKKCYQ